MKPALAILLLYLLPVLADACSCAALSFEEQMKIATAVFTGKALKVEEETEGTIRIDFKTEQVWKGPWKETITVYTPADSAACGYTFREGTEYLVYATGEKRLSAILCSRTAPVGEASEDLDKLDASRRTSKVAKRDPFTEQHGERMRVQKAVPRALNVTNAVIVGITKRNQEYVALIRATNNRVYFLKVGDKLHDGVVVKIDNNSVTFRRNRSSVLIKKELRPFPD